MIFFHQFIPLDLTLSGKLCPRTLSRFHGLLRNADSYLTDADRAVQTEQCRAEPLEKAGEREREREREKEGEGRRRKEKAFPPTSLVA